MSEFAVNIYMLVALVVVVVMFRGIPVAPYSSASKNGHDDESVIDYLDSTDPANAEMYPTHPAHLDPNN